MERNIILTYPPVSSPWHLPVGTSTLTAMLRAQGGNVLQRYAHISGLEYVLRSIGGQKADDALIALREATCDIKRRYEARMTLEGISGRILPDNASDEFVVLRNNVHYAAAGYSGTIESLVRCIRNRATNLFYDYFAEVEIPLALGHGPKLYGISINDERQLVPGWILAAMIKEALPGTLVVLGGNFWPRMEHAFKLPEFGQLFGFCDAIVYAEGFQPLTALAATLEPAGIAGVVWCDRNKIVVNKKTAKSTPFEELPTPDFDGGATIWCPHEVLPLYTQSDCPHKCAFCAIPAGSDTDRTNPKSRPRTMSAARIAHHMHSLAPTASRFDIFDETFDVNRQIEVGEKLRRLGTKATWQCYLTITKDMLYPERCKALYDAGCRAVQLGLETLSTTTLAQENKKWNHPTTYARILRNLWEAGIQVHVFIMVGIPGEKITDTMRWLPFITDNGNSVLTWKPSRYRLSRGAPEERDETKRSPLVVVPEKDACPLRLNREFSYKETNDERRPRKRKGRTGGVDSVQKDIEAALVLIEETERRHWAHALASTLAWWPNRGCYTEEQLRTMAKELPPEPEVLHVRESLDRMERIVEAELGRKVSFYDFDDAVNFFRTI